MVLTQKALESDKSFLTGGLWLTGEGTNWDLIFKCLSRVGLREANYRQILSTGCVETLLCVQIKTMLFYIKDDLLKVDEMTTKQEHTVEFEDAGEASKNACCICGRLKQLSNECTKSNGGFSCELMSSNREKGELELWEKLLDKAKLIVTQKSVDDCKSSS
ncbi:hypothetical protein NC653_001309 [Populus alba x Populus x berolinensis]|uniref:Uncharacterized protein n=1 Tax=Populus alba x Populus x berolinensis TaxID=444605 RepID=A0AAD6WFU3_9ROSI|nr:hypothetical protein NC653_001309 [Populus alba x Populus x berolinensis]